MKPDAIIIGTGPGGSYLARERARRLADHLNN